MIAAKGQKPRNSTIATSSQEQQNLTNIFIQILLAQLRLLVLKERDISTHLPIIIYISLRSILQSGKMNSSNA